MSGIDKNRELTKTEQDLSTFILELVRKGKELEAQERLAKKGIKISDVFEEEQEEIVIDLRGRF